MPEEILRNAYEYLLQDQKLFELLRVAAHETEVAQGYAVQVMRSRIALPRDRRKERCHEFTGRYPKKIIQTVLNEKHAYAFSVNFFLYK